MAILSARLRLAASDVLSNMASARRALALADRAVAAAVALIPAPAPAPAVAAPVAAQVVAVATATSVVVITAAAAVVTVTVVVCHVVVVNNVVEEAQGVAARCEQREMGLGNPGLMSKSVLPDLQPSKPNPWREEGRL